MSTLLRHDESPLASVIKQSTDGKRAQRERDLELLRSWLRPGDIVLTATLHRSRSGGTRVVGAWAVNVPERAALQSALTAFEIDGSRAASATVLTTGRQALDATAARPRTTRIWAFAARVLNRRADLDRGGVVMRDGEGGNELVRELATVLYRDADALTNEEL